MVLATLLLDRADPAAAADEAAPAATGGADADFALWLRVVLPPDEATRFRSWARANPAACRAIRRKFGQATGDDDFEALLRETRAALATNRQIGRRR